MPARAFCPTKRETKSASSSVSNNRVDKFVRSPGKANINNDGSVNFSPIRESLSFSMAILLYIEKLFQVISMPEKNTALSDNDIRCTLLILFLFFLFFQQS